MTRCQLRGTMCPVSFSFSNAQITPITSRPLTLFPPFSYFVIRFSRVPTVCLSQPISHNSPAPCFRSSTTGSVGVANSSASSFGSTREKLEELAERRLLLPEVGVVGPDLWWGSSAYRAELAGSLSVDKPVLRGNLQGQKGCKKQNKKQPTVTM